MNPIGKWRRRALETRRSPYRPGMLVCTRCTAKRKAQGKTGLVGVRATYVYHDGLHRPGVECPHCGLTWIEQEDQPEAIHA